MGIRLKEGVDIQDFLKIEAKLGVLIYETVHQFNLLGVDNITITSLIRPKTNDSGVHALGRGCDIRVNDLKEDIVNKVVVKTNSLFTYNIYKPDKRCAMVHEVNNQGKHLHLQVS